MNYNKLLNTFSIVSLGLLLIILYLTDSLKYYVRPEFSLFTLVMGGFIVCIGLFSFGETVKHRQRQSISILQIISNAIIIFVCILGITIPKYQLSSRIATNRTIQQYTIPDQLAIKKVIIHSPLLSTVDSTNYSLSDWISLFLLDPEPTRYEGKQAKITGFVQRENQTTFRLSQYVITCCIVDATPISIPVHIKDSMPDDDNWVVVEGKFIIEEENQIRRLVLEANSIEKISKPDTPYAY